jgi:hypothetical protein
LGKADEFLCYGLSIHLLHDPDAVDLGGLHGSFPLSSNLLIQHSMDHKKNFQLSQRQGLDASFNF